MRRAGQRCGTSVSMIVLSYSLREATFLASESLIRDSLSVRIRRSFCRRRAVQKRQLLRGVVDGYQGEELARRFSEKKLRKEWSMEQQRSRGVGEPRGWTAMSAMALDKTILLPCLVRHAPSSFPICNRVVGMGGEGRWEGIGRKGRGGGEGGEGGGWHLDLLLLLLILENLPVYLLALLLEILDTCQETRHFTSSQQRPPRCSRLGVCISKGVPRPTLPRCILAMAS